MFGKLATLAACLSLASAAAIGSPTKELNPRQTANYPDNGTAPMAFAYLYRLLC